MVVENKNRKPELPISLILTCHKKYADLGYLKTAIDSIDHQIYPFTEKILVCDGFELGSTPVGWNVIRSNCHSPCGSRNMGLISSTQDWVLPFDADNVMAHDYTIRVYDTYGMLQEIDSNVAFIYNDFEQIDSNMQTLQYIEYPEFDYWKLREENYVDTASITRRSAIMEVGGWDTQLKTHEDYAIYLNMTRIGYRGEKLRGAVLRYRKHDLQLHNMGDCVTRQAETRWRAQTFCVVGLLAGRVEYLDRWFRWLEEARLPYHTDLCLVDNSNSRKFSMLLMSKINTVINSGRFNKVSYTCCPKQCKDVQEIGRHRHVSMLYNLVLPEINTDFVVTFEDDVLPPNDALWKIFRPFSNHRRLAAVGAVVPTKDRPGRCIAALGADYWSETPALENVKGKMLHVNYIGGGLTIWGNWMLKKCLPFRARIRNGLMDGWDGFLCRMIRNDGRIILLDGRVFCKHGEVGSQFS